MCCAPELTRSNGFGILTAAGGAKLAWWIDPMGATIIAVCIIAVWTRTVYGVYAPLTRLDKLMSQSNIPILPA